MAIKTSKSSTNHFATYKTSKRWEANRKRRLERALKQQPNNEQIKAALKGGMVYRRRTPTNNMWSHTWIRAAKLIKEVTGKFDPQIMSSNPEAARNALQRATCHESYKAVPNPFKSMFSIEARLYKGPAR